MVILRRFAALFFLERMYWILFLWVRSRLLLLGSKLLLWWTRRLMIVIYLIVNAILSLCIDEILIINRDDIIVETVCLAILLSECFIIITSCICVNVVLEMRLHLLLHGKKLFSAIRCFWKCAVSSFSVIELLGIKEIQFSHVWWFFKMRWLI